MRTRRSSLLPDLSIYLSLFLYCTWQLPAIAAAAAAAEEARGEGGAAVATGYTDNPRPSE